MNGGKWVAKYGKNVAPGKMQKSKVEKQVKVIVKYFLKYLKYNDDVVAYKS